VLTTIEKQLHSGVVESEPGVGEPLLETRIMVRAIGQFIVLMRTMIVSIRSNQRENGRKLEGRELNIALGCSFSGVIDGLEKLNSGVKERGVRECGNITKGKDTGSKKNSGSKGRLGGTKST